MSLKTRIKTLDDHLKQKEQEIDSLYKTDNPAWSRKRQKVEAGYAKVLGLVGDIEYLKSFQTGEVQLPEADAQVTDGETEVLLLRSLELRNMVFEAHKTRSELTAKISENPVKKNAIDQKIAQINDKLKGYLANFHSMRVQLGLDWLEFSALESFLNQFRIENKPRIAFLKESLE